MTIGVARPAPPFLLGFDVLDRLPLAVLRGFRQAHFLWIGRYLETLTDDEVQDIFSAGLSIHPLTEAVVGTPLDSNLGAQRAAFEVGRARDRGIPETVHLTVDFEAPEGTREGCLDYLRSATGGIAASAYGASVYVAPPQPLSGVDLFSLQDTHMYWAGAGVVPELACGYGIRQLLPLEWLAPWASVLDDEGQVRHYPVDGDVISADRHGRLPVLWSPQ